MRVDTGPKIIKEAADDAQAKLNEQAAGDGEAGETIELQHVSMYF